MLILEQITNESLDAVLSLEPKQQANYFSKLTKQYFPKVEEDSQEFLDLIETYISCFYVEKLYRSNQFFQEKFTPIYTNTGLIRNIIPDIYFLEESLIVH